MSSQSQKIKKAFLPLPLLKNIKNKQKGTPIFVQNIETQKILRFILTIKVYLDIM